MKPQDVWKAWTKFCVVLEVEEVPSFEQNHLAESCAVLDLCNPQGCWGRAAGTPMGQGVTACPFSPCIWIAAEGQWVGLGLDHEVLGERGMLPTGSDPSSVVMRPGDGTIMNSGVTVLIMKS